MPDGIEHREAGMALLPTVLLLVVLAVFLLIFLENQYSSSVSIGHYALHHLETQALDQGGEAASNTLNAYTNWPELLPSSVTAPAYSPLPANQYPTQPSAAFWSSCAQNNQCASYSATENGVSFSGEYVIYPGNGLAEPLSGYEDQQNQVGPTSRQYVAFVRVQDAQNSAVVVREFVLRKSLL